jgi:predicted transcriptional regulator
MTNKLKIGIASYADVKARTMAIARGEYKPGKDELKIWFTSEKSTETILRDKRHPMHQAIKKIGQPE